MKTLHLLSGGIDSYVGLRSLLKGGVPVECIGFHYGQDHYIELDYAKRIAAKCGVKFRMIELSSIFCGSSLVGGTGSVVVAFRNGVFLSVSCAIAEDLGFDWVTYCPTTDDYEKFLDCRMGFVNAFNETLKASGLKVRVNPLTINQSKRQVCERGKELGIDFEDTMSCYRGNNCGGCLACLKRKEALLGL